MANLQVGLPFYTLQNHIAHNNLKNEPLSLLIIFTFTQVFNIMKCVSGHLFAVRHILASQLGYTVFNFSQFLQLNRIST